MSQKRLLNMEDSNIEGTRRLLQLAQTGIQSRAFCELYTCDTIPKWEVRSIVKNGGCTLELSRAKKYSKSVADMLNSECVCEVGYLNVYWNICKPCYYLTISQCVSLNTPCTYGAQSVVCTRIVQLQRWIARQCNNLCELAWRRNTYWKNNSYLRNGGRCVGSTATACLRWDTRSVSTIEGKCEKEKTEHQRTKKSDLCNYWIRQFIILQAQRNKGERYHQQVVLWFE